MGNGSAMAAILMYPFGLISKQLFLEMDTALLLLVWCFCANESIKFAGWRVG